MADAPDGFAVLTEDVELPAMWPSTAFGDFAGGGVGACGSRSRMAASRFSRGMDDPAH